MFVPYPQKQALLRTLVYYPNKSLANHALQM
jgi:hypothetical protein